MFENKERSETERLEALRQYDVLDTPPEASFDRITRLAQVALETPIVLVSLVDEDRQWFKSRQGLDACETAREISFCTHAIDQNEPLIVRDALKDPRFRENPLVTGTPHIRFYIGVPLRTPDGHNIGTLCAIDSQPRDPSTTQINVMQDLARLVVNELELRRLATIDSLTGAMTRRAFECEASQEIARATRYKRDLGCVMIDIDHFKAINDRHGHAAGDLALHTVVDICKKELRTIDMIGRLGGEEFAVMLPETKLSGARTTAERLRRAIADAVIEHGSDRIEMTASFGVTCFSPSDESLECLIERADAALYEAKHGGRNQTVCVPPDGDYPSETAKIA